MLLYLIPNLFSLVTPGLQAEMREAIMEGQDEFLMRNTECADVDMCANNRAHLEDVAQNADLYIANQAVSSQP